MPENTPYSIPPHLLRDYIESMTKFLLTWQSYVKKHDTMRDVQMQSILSAEQTLAHRNCCAAYDYMVRNRPDFPLPEYDELPQEIRDGVALLFELYADAPSTMHAHVRRHTYELVRQMHLFLAVPLRDWRIVESNQEKLKT